MEGGLRKEKMSVRWAVHKLSRALRGDGEDYFAHSDKVR